MRFTLVSGTGNVFALFDGFSGDLPDDPAAAARELCAAPLGELPQVQLEPRNGARLDGVLLLLPPREGGDCRMVVYNADGSRPESCGNGLRCIALVARQREHVAQDEFTIESDAGPKRARVFRELQGDPASPIVSAEISMGEPHVELRRVSLKTRFGPVEATLVDMGNPHCVVFVSDEREAPVAQLGAELERHRHFPGRTNVEFVTVHPHELSMRVWERGVGETAACGTGACAAAVAAVLTQRAQTPIAVRLPGGMLEVDWDGVDGEVRLKGACQVLAQGRWSAETAAKPSRT